MRLKPSAGGMLITAAESAEPRVAARRTSYYQPV